jgi:hypothetical protein
MRSAWLGLALVPYLAAAAVDAWMHERGRRVPRVEQWIHAGLAATMAVFLGAVFAAAMPVALGALAGFLALLAWDETAFHRTINREERRVHVFSWLALAAFVAVWLVVDLA